LRDRRGIGFHHAFYTSNVNSQRLWRGEPTGVGNEVTRAFIEEIDAAGEG